MKSLASSIEVFVSAAGALLIAAALIQGMTALGDSQMFGMPDPVLGIPTRWMAICITAAEFTVGWICLFGKSLPYRSMLLAWLMTNWAVYQGGLAYLGFHRGCTALGTLTDPLRLAGGELARTMDALPFVLLIGGYLAAIQVWISSPRRREQNYLKIACPGCGGHIELPASTLYSKIACPHCGGGIHPQNLARIA